MKKKPKKKQVCASNFEVGIGTFSPAMSIQSEQASVFAKRQVTSGQTDNWTYIARPCHNLILASYRLSMTEM